MARRSFSLLNWSIIFGGGLMGKNDGEGSPNWCSSNDPDPVDCVELDPVYTSVLSSAIWQIYSRKKIKSIIQQNVLQGIQDYPRLF